MDNRDPDIDYTFQMIHIHIKIQVTVNLRDRTGISREGEIRCITVTYEVELQ